jgi:hypothetical protein
MRNILNKNCRENKTHILCSITFSESRTIYEIMSKNVVDTEGPQMTTQYGAYALRAGLARLHAHMRMHTPTRSVTHMHSRTRKHALTDQYVIFIVFHGMNGFVNAPYCYVIRTLPVLLYLDRFKAYNSVSPRINILV